MVPPRPCSWWNCLPRSHGYQRRHIQHPSRTQLTRGYSEYLCPTRTWIQCAHCLGNIHVRNITYLVVFVHPITRFTTEMKDQSAGLLAAAFIGIVPGYISRSVAGSYDNEAIAIFLLMFTFFCWIKALKLGSALYGTVAAVFYFYMVAAWGEFSSCILITPLADLNGYRWLCLYHQHDSSACSLSYPYGQVQQSSLCSLLLLVRYWDACKYASPFRRVSTSQDK